jgi:hypothetical protein
MIATVQNATWPNIIKEIQAAAIVTINLMISAIVVFIQFLLSE